MPNGTVSGPHGPSAGGCAAARDGGSAAVGQGSECARLESNQHTCRIRAVLSTELRASMLGFLTRRCVPVGEWDSVESHGALAGGCAAARGGGKPPPVREAREPPAGIEPAPRPYKGRVLPLTLRRQEVEMAGVEPAPPRCKRGALPPELHPQGCSVSWRVAACPYASGTVLGHRPARRRACSGARRQLRCRRPGKRDADGWSRTTRAGGTRVTAWGAHPCSASA